MPDADARCPIPFAGPMPSSTSLPSLLRSSSLRRQVRAQQIDIHHFATMAVTARIRPSVALWRWAQSSISSSRAPRPIPVRTRTLPRNLPCETLPRNVRLCPISSLHRRESSTVTVTTRCNSTTSGTHQKLFADVEKLHPHSKKALEKLGLVTMTEIQSKTFDAASSGKDVLGRARTGTGKTLAFLLPTMENILKQNMEPGKSLGALILSPTRELALQIFEQAQSICNFHNGLSCQVMFGGTSRKQDEVRLRKRLPSILVATPGRLQDHLSSTKINGVSFAALAKQTKVLVLDETDRLLDLGFRSDIDRILSYLPAKRQTMLFSATLPRSVRSVMSDTMKPDYLSVDCMHDFDPASHTNAQVEQYCIIHPTSLQIDYPVEYICNVMDKNPDHKIVAFFPTANMTSYYSQIFNFILSRPVIEIHSRKTQSYRNSASNRFREKDGGIVMFTSDVSARGVDYPNVTDVIQVGIADSRETYIHRLGRTGRAGKAGRGTLILSDMEKKFVTNALNGLEIIDESDRLSLGNQSRHLNAMRRSIVEGRNGSIAKVAKGAYCSMLGYYATKLRMIGVRNKSEMVKFVNNFSAASGLTDPPKISSKIADSIGLKGIPGINISKGDSNRKHGGRRNSRNGGRQNTNRKRKVQRCRHNDDGSMGRGSYDGWGTKSRW